MDAQSNWSDASTSGGMKKPASSKFAHIASEAEKQGATLTGGFYSQLDRLSTNYTRRVTIPKNPRTYYIGEDVKHRPSVIYLEALNAKRREAELEAQAEEIQREVRRQKKAEERRKKREAAEKLKRERDEELQRAIAEEREREDSTKSNGAFKAYGGDRFGTRGDYSEGMLYLSRITVSRLDDFNEPCCSNRRCIGCLLLNIYRYSVCCRFIVLSGYRLTNHIFSRNTLTT